MILFGYPFGHVHAPRQMVTATACDPAASKGRFCGLLTVLIIATSSYMSTGPKPETPSSPARKTSFQHTIAAVAVPPLPNTALEPQMLTFPNIGRAIAGTPDFMR